MNGLGRFPLMVISFVLSLILWAYVQIQENPPKQTPTVFSVKLEARGLPTSMRILNVAPDSIKIFPRGPADEWAKVSEVSGNYDVAKALASVRSFPARVTVPVRIVPKAEFGVDIGDLRYDPKTQDVTVTVDALASRQVPISVQSSGELPRSDQWYLPDVTYAEPNVVTVTGPKSEVDNIASARAVLNLSQAFPGGTLIPMGPIELLEKDPSRQELMSVTFEPKSVLIHPGIAVGLQDRSVYIFANYHGQPAPGFTVDKVEFSPPNVDVKGRPEVLARVSFVRADVDVSNLKETTTLSVIPKSPRPDVFLSSSQPISVRITITPNQPPVVPKKPEQAPPKARRKR